MPTTRPTWELTDDETRSEGVERLATRVREPQRREGKGVADLGLRWRRGGGGGGGGGGERFLEGLEVRLVADHRLHHPCSSPAPAEDPTRSVCSAESSKLDGGPGPVAGPAACYSLHSNVMFGSLLNFS